MAIIATAKRVSNNNVGTPGTSLVLTATGYTTGDWALVTVSIATTTASVVAVVDGMLNSYTLVGTVQHASGVRVELWAFNPNFTNASLNVTITISSSSLMSACIQPYSGATSLGSFTTTQGTNTFTFGTATLQDATNFAFLGIGWVSVSTDTIALRAGTTTVKELSSVPTSPSVGSAIFDATQFGTGTMQPAATLNVSHAWATIGVELRTGVAFSAYYDMPSTTFTSLARAESILEPTSGISAALTSLIRSESYIDVNAIQLTEGDQLGYVTVFNEPARDAGSLGSTTGILTFF